MDAWCYGTGYLLWAWLMADLLSGIGHWAEDRYFREDWPVLGPLVASPNQLHHQQPTAFLAGGYWQRNSTTLAPTWAAAAACWACGQNWWALVFLCLSQANQTHAWSHQRAGQAVRLLQSGGLLASPREHAKHHRAPFDMAYCVMSDWLNPWLDHFCVWSRLETLLRCCGIVPR